MTGDAPVRRGLAVPCFAEDPAWLVRLGIDAERAGFAARVQAAGPAG